MSASGLFDIHQHFGQLSGFHGLHGRSATIEDDLKARLAMMDRFGVAACALMPSHAYAAPRGAADVAALNDALLDYQQLAPDRFPVAAPTADPRHGRQAVAEVERVHARGARALSWHQRFQGLPMDHPAMFEIVAQMDRLGMTAMCHCYANGDFESPWRLRRLAEAFPQTSFVALDAMTSPENLEQILAVAEVLPNVYFDLTSSLLGVDGVRRSLDRLGPTRLVFGTNYYSLGAPEEQHDVKLLFAATGGMDEARRLAGGDNARRIFGLLPATNASTRR